jgi:hypothetical protein
MRGLAVALLSALAVAAPAHAKPVLGITGDLPRFQTLTGQQSIVHQAFVGWGQGLSYGSPFVTLFGTLEPVPMIHLSTGARPPSKQEAITPAQIASGTGDSYLFALNQTISQWGKAIYVRPMAEMNNYGNLWSGFTKSGAAKAGHSPTDYRKAFARIYLILHGGSAATLNAKLRRLGLPGVAPDLASNPFPRLRVVWSPLAGGNPRIPANAAQNYYPGAAYVDVDGGDIFEEGLGDTAPWRDLEALYTAAVAHHRPFSVPEWGLFGVDDDLFVTHMCRFLKGHGRTEEAGFFESKPGALFDIAPKPKSKRAYHDCITPYGAALPSWAQGAAASGPATPDGPSVAFTLQGQAIASSGVSAPVGANGLEVNIAPATGVIGSAFWIRDGHSLGPMTVPSGATGLAFQTKPGAASPPIVRPTGGTDFHVVWNASDVITSAWWTRVGKMLAQIPVAAGQTAIAMTQG